MAELKKALGPVMLWGLGVGYVISGMYFGWNLGLPLGGTWGMLIATGVVTVLYFAFSAGYAELAVAMPRAGGAFDFGLRAFGPAGGLVLGVAQIVEFLFAPPAIAIAIGAYFNLFYPGASPTAIAIVVYVLFTALNAWGVKQAAAFELAVTVAAVGELLLFMAVSGSRFHAANLAIDPFPHGFSGVFACLPFAVWMFLGIEGLANAAEEARAPERDRRGRLPPGHGHAGGARTRDSGHQRRRRGLAGGRLSDAGRRRLRQPAAARARAHRRWARPALSPAGDRRPARPGRVVSRHRARGRARRVRARADRLRPALPRARPPAHGHPGRGARANAVIGIAAILSSRTGDLIVLSGLGAVALYGLSMVALFVLRRRAPDLPRPYRAWGYPVVPALALGLAALCLGSMIWYNRTVAALFGGMLAAAAVYAGLARRGLHEG